MTTTTTPVLSPAESRQAPRANIRGILRRLWRTPEGKVGLILFAVILFFALAGPQIAPYDPLKVAMKERFQAPNREYWFGTDEVGRDVYSRVIYGTRISLSSALVVIVLAASAGIPLGMLAGYRGGAVDNIIMRVTDMFLGFPAMLLAIAVAGALGPGLMKGMVASALVWWPGYARLARGQVLVTREQLFVEAARSIGASHGRILFRHILPHLIYSIIVFGTLGISTTVLLEATLSYLGVGVQPPTPSWGNIIFENQTYFANAPWLVFFPGLAIVLLALAFNLLGDALRDALDPKLKGRH